MLVILYLRATFFFFFFFIFIFNSGKFWENLTHPLVTGIHSDVDEVRTRNVLSAPRVILLLVNFLFTQSNIRITIKALLTLSVLGHEILSLLFPTTKSTSSCPVGLLLNKYTLKYVAMLPFHLKFHCSCFKQLDDFQFVFLFYRIIDITWKSTVMRCRLLH